MIIQSLLDTDLYKFTMMQVVLHHFPGAQVEYRFNCRTRGMDISPYLDEIRAELEKLCTLRFTEPELEYLRAMRFIKSDFVDFLGLFQLNMKSIRIERNPASSGGVDIAIVGPWLHTILFEIPVLAIVNEVYFRNTQPDPDYAEGRRRLREKIALIHDNPQMTGCRIADYGSRRRFSRAWHDEVLATLKTGLGENLAGTSNVLYARKHALTPLGTMAHEYLQACQALGPRLRDSQTFGFEMWAREYRGDLGIALSDVYGMDAFLRDFDMYFCKLFDGARHDSGDPIVLGRASARALRAQSRRSAHQDSRVLRFAGLSARHRVVHALQGSCAHRLRSRHQPDQRSGLHADADRDQDGPLQRTAGRQAVGFS